MSLSKKNYTKFTKDKYSRNDYLNVREAFLNEKDQDKLNLYLREDWDEINKQNLSDKKSLQHLLHKIHYTINRSGNEQHTSKIKQIWNVYLRVAAVLLIPILIASAYYFFNDSTPLQSGVSFTEIHAPLGTRTKFTLPDGSTGWLNSGSVLKYSQPFEQNRNVELNGEAYFDVKHLNNTPFMVKFSDLYVNVLGTRFNIMAYDEEETSEVILEQGKVEIINEEQQPISDLNPDQIFVLNKENNSAIIQRVNASNYTSWKEGKLVFRNEPMANVIRRLSRWYNVDFEITDDRLLEINYRATLVDEQLSEVLRLLSLSAPIQYEIEERKMNKEDEFIKRKVILSYRKTK